jgi:uncharacterized protein YndB with AHSA1/START domain
MLKLVAFALLVAVALVLFLASRRPDTFRVQRSVEIAAPPEAIFPLISDLQAFITWSPFEGKDPAMKRTFSGPRSGPGAVYEFAGNSQVGRGRLELTEADPPHAVTFRLDMHAPMAASNVVEFTLLPVGSGTRVTWAMHGPSSFLPKLLGLFMDMEGMVGQEFERGLAALAALAERRQLDRPRQPVA